MKLPEEKIVKEYLDRVKEKLPGWLRDKKKELKDVLAELEEHLWDKAAELGQGEITVDSVRQATVELGAPQKIAREYKRRGTPKVWISEELWPTYLSIVKVVLAIVLAVNVIGYVLEGLTSGDWLAALGAFNGLWTGLLAAFAIVSIIFVALSMEGYFPEDFKSERELRKEREKARAKVRADARERPLDGGEIPKEDRMVKVGETLVGGFFGIFFLLLLLSARGFFPADFFAWLVPVCIIGLLDSGLDIARALLGNHPSTIRSHQGLLVMKVVLGLVAIPFVVVLFQNPEIVPWFAWAEGDGVLTVVPFPTEHLVWLRLVVGLAVLGTIAGAISNLYRAVTLKQKYGKLGASKVCA